ncbi:MAG TPA: hypothetical protein VJW75_01865 [Candidatus Eisenbacteria bacterium]|nr:hypothetical protein [Candidatus Eisenbacteria bacterium]
MIRFLAQLLLALFVVRVIFATARFLSGSRRRPLAPPPSPPSIPKDSPRTGSLIDRESAIDVPFTEISDPRP